LLLARSLSAQIWNLDLSEMEVRTFVSKYKVFWDQLLAFRAITVKEKACTMRFRANITNEIKND